MKMIRHQTETATRLHAPTEIYYSIIIVIDSTYIFI